MDLETIRAAFGWAALIHVGFLLWWGLLFILARGWIYRMHTRWFRLPEDRFDAFHYGGMGLYKVLVLVFVLVPYLALRIVG